MSVLHARLRNKCSGLNGDLFRNHIRYNPFCELCDVVEDAYHYFFQCRKYTVERQVFNDTVRGFQFIICQFLMILFLPKFMINVTTLILKLSISHF